MLHTTFKKDLLHLHPHFKIPHVFIFLFWIIILCSALSYILPSGAYEREDKVIDNVTQHVVVPGSYEEIPKNVTWKGVLKEDHVDGMASPVSIFGVLKAVPKGMAQSAVLIFFIFAVGAVFNIVFETHSIQALLFYLIDKFNHHPKLLFFLIYLVASAGCAFFGIALEVMPLIPLLIVLAIQTGYDRMFGVGLATLPLWIGWSTATTNPFNVQIAQQIAELPIGSGIGLRFILFGLGVIVGFGYLMRYGNKVKNHHELAYKEEDVTDIEEHGIYEKVHLTSKHVMILTIVAVSYAIIMYSVQTAGWGLIEMTAGFIAIGILVIFAGRLNSDQAMEAFVKGLEKMIVPALVVGVARGISVVMVEGQIMDTVLHFAGEMLIAVPKSFSTVGMLIFQSILNFFIPSASGQALVSMPLMTPLSDILGISRQVAVLAFVLGDGFTNMIIPTNGVLMAMLGIAGVPFNKWVKFVLPLFFILIGMAIIVLLIAVRIGY